MRIGHASIAETGGVYGTPGDQTGKEVCERGWYDSGWDYMAIHPDPLVRDRHAKAVEQACANPCVGYSWDNRNSLYQQARLVDMDIARITTPCNCDCSSLQNCAAVASRAPGVRYGDNGWVTGNMRPALEAAGYRILSDPALLSSADFCVRGAIYVSSGHTVCGLDDGARAAETLRAADLPVGEGLAPPAEDASGDPDPAPDPEDPPQDPETPPADESGPDTISLPAPPPGWSYVPLPTLDLGDASEAVRAAQLLLKGRGFAVGWMGADGELGPKTESAVVKFQRSRYLEQDGVVGPETWGRLIRDAPGPV